MWVTNIRMGVLIVLGLAFAAVTAAKIPFDRSQRIIGGSLTDIESYPDMAAMLRDEGLGPRQSCGGVILNNRAILSAAHCFERDTVDMWQARLGSSNANSGGIVYKLVNILMHPEYNVPVQLNNDVAIVYVASRIVYSDVVQPAKIAGPNYIVGDDQEVWVTGWGVITVIGPMSERLRHVQVWTVNQEECVKRYQELDLEVTDDMLCSGWLDVGRRDSCSGDSGGPVYHNDVVVAITSWGSGCAIPRHPSVNVRVSSVSSWIQSNA